MEISVKSLKKICRVCLVERDDMKSLFLKAEGDDRDLFEILEFTANINVQIEDNLPKQVCCECKDVMCKADAFKRRCLESEKILNNLFEFEASKEETLSIIDNECSIKHENGDFNQQLSNHDGCPPNDATQESFDVKNGGLFKVVAVYPSNEPSICNIDTNISENCALQVKVEAVNNYEEDTDFSSHYNDSGPVETDYLDEANTVKKLKVFFQCNCGLRFNGKDKYKTHTKLGNCKQKKVKQKLSKKVTSKSQFRCADCEEEFKTLSSWKKHQQICSHHKNLDNNDPPILEDSYQCLFCLCTFKTKELLATHKHEKTDDKTELFQCSLCLRRFKNKTALSAHLQRHKETDNIKHVCKICKREFKYKAYLENHILTMHSKKNSLSCEVCGQSFTNEKILEEHKDSHTNNKKHQCSVCSKLFVMSCTLKEHMRTHTGEKPFLCSQCGRGFSQKTNLAQHMRRHQGLKPFKCENCEKRFVSKGELDAHNRKHSGAHPFVCDDCGNGFTTSSALVKHRRIHTGEKPYQCDLCPMRFAASGTLKNHRRTHTGERPFQCSYCEKAFVQRNDLISHIRCHTGEKPYVCTQCGQSFRKAAALKTHVKMHAKESVGMMQGVMLNGMQCAEQ